MVCIVYKKGLGLLRAKSERNKQIECTRRPAVCNTRRVHGSPYGCSHAGLVNRHWLIKYQIT